jgi:hypothetical protein
MNRRVQKTSLLASLKRLPSLAASRLGALGAKLRLPRLSRKNRRQVKLVDRLTRTPPPVEGAPAERPTWRQRMLTLAAWLAPIAAAGVAFAVPLISARSYEYVMESGYFHVRHVVVDQTSTRVKLYPSVQAPTPHLSKNEILEIAGIGAGTHLIEADIDTMGAKLEAHPWIRWARVERELPDTLHIHVIEHVPTAFLAPMVELSGDATAAVPGLALVDELGAVFAPATFDKVLRLPVISGIALSRLESTSETASIQKDLAAALNVLRIWNSQKLSRRYPIGELRILPGGAYALVLEGRGVGAPTEVMLGRGPFREKLLRLEFILEHLRDAGKLPEYVLLDLSDEADPRAVEVGGARVVVKANLAFDPVEAIAESVTTDTPDTDGMSGRARDREPAPVEDRPVPAVESHPARQNPQAGAEAETVPEAPGSNAPHENDNKPDSPGEGAPLTGGRPADDLGEE